MKIPLNPPPHVKHNIGVQGYRWVSREVTGTLDLIKFMNKAAILGLVK